MAIAFGKEVKPGSPYVHLSEGRTLHLTHAALGYGNSTQKTTLRYNTVVSSPISICSFMPGRVENVPLNIFFKEDDEVIFSVKGRHTVFITGFFDIPEVKENENESQSEGGDDEDGDEEREGDVDEENESEDEDEDEDEGFEDSETESESDAEDSDAINSEIAFEYCWDLVAIGNDWWSGCGVTTRNGDILSCSHIFEFIKDFRSIKARRFDRPKTELFNMEILTQMVSTDLTVLKFVVKPKFHLPYPHVSDDESLTVGENVYYVGSSGNNIHKISKGYISYASSKVDPSTFTESFDWDDYRTDLSRSHPYNTFGEDIDGVDNNYTLRHPCCPVIICQIKCERGGSGGPLFRRSGELIGILRSGSYLVGIFVHVSAIKWILSLVNAEENFIGPVGEPDLESDDDSTDDGGNSGWGSNNEADGGGGGTGGWGSSGGGPSSGGGWGSSGGGPSSGGGWGSTGGGPSSGGGWSSTGGGPSIGGGWGSSGGGPSIGSGSKSSSRWGSDGGSGSSTRQQSEVAGKDNRDWGADKIGPEGNVSKGGGNRGGWGSNSSGGGAGGWGNSGGGSGADYANAAGENSGWGGNKKASGGAKVFKKKQPARGIERSCLQFVLETLYRIDSQVIGKRHKSVGAASAELGVTRSNAAYKPKVRPLLRLACSSVFGSGTGFTDMLVHHIPSARDAASREVEHIYTGPKKFAIYSSMVDCKPSDLLMVNTNLYPKYNFSTLDAIGRVYSDELQKGQSVRVLKEGYSPDDEEDMIKKEVTNLWAYQDRYKIPIRKAFLGSWVLIESVDAFIMKPVTFCNVRYDDDVYIYRPLQFSTLPVAKTVTEPLNPSELPKMVEGLRNLSKCHTLATTKLEESGEHTLLGRRELCLDFIKKGLLELYVEVEVKIADPVVSFCTMGVGSSSLKCYAETPNKKKEITTIAKSLEKGLAEDFGNGVVSLDLAHKKPGDFVQTKYDWHLLAACGIWAFGPDKQDHNIFLEDTLPSECEGSKLMGNDDNILLIRKGKLVYGVIYKAQYDKYCLAHTVQELFGAGSSGLLLSAPSRVFTTFLQTHGFTCGMDDLMIQPKYDNKRKKELEVEDVGEEVHSNFVKHKLGSTGSMKLQHLEMEKAVHDSGQSAISLLDLKIRNRLIAKPSAVNKYLLLKVISKPFLGNCMALMHISGANSGTYTFPPSYGVGEVGRVGAPTRREIGHGILTERALQPIYITT